MQSGTQNHTNSHSTDGWILRVRGKNVPEHPRKDLKTKQKKKSFPVPKKIQTNENVEQNAPIDVQRSMNTQKHIMK
jgi:hypothetical protein